jgi:acyl phosphate:glycerol-3-phosphate acyltransferase
MGAFLLIAVLSYLLGSIPFGYILVRAFRKQDVRQTGSGNIGATNVARAFPGLGMVTLLLDASKGAAAVLLARVLVPDQKILAGAAAFCAVAGHVFPLWLGFRGGKGVSTGLGSFIMLAPKAVLLAVGVFVAVVLLFRYVSLGSIAAVALFPFFAWWLQNYAGERPMIGFMAATSILIVAMHSDNIRRLGAGTESRFAWRRR